MNEQTPTGTWTTYELIAGALIAVTNDLDAGTYSYRHPWTGERCEHPLSESTRADVVAKVVSGRASRS